MNKKIPLLLFCLFFFSVIFIESIFATESKNIEDYAPLNVVFSSDIDFYAGFTTDGKVASVGELVENAEQQLYFGYDSGDGSFNISNLFYYVQVFVNGPIEINLWSSGPLKNNSGKTIEWSSVARDTQGFGSHITAGNKYKIIDESTITTDDYCRYPRPYSGEIMIRIPAENVTDTTSSYSTTLTLEVVKK